MANGTNLWQLRTDCLRSLGQHTPEGNGQQQAEIAAHENVRPLRGKVRELETIGLSETALAEDRETRHTAKNAA